MLRRFRFVIPLVYLVWGSTFPVGKVALASFDATTLVALRFALGGLVLLAIALRSPVRRYLGPRFLLLALSIGALQYFGYYYYVYLGMRTVPAGKTAVIASAYPLLVLVIEWLIYRRKLRTEEVLGVSLGLCGVAIASGVDFRSLSAIGSGEVYVLFGTICIAVASFIWNKSPETNVDALTALSMLFGAGCAVIVMLLPHHAAKASFTPAGLVSLAYLTLMGSVFVFLIWNRLVARRDLVEVSSLNFVVPLVAASLSVLFLNERLTVHLLLGTLFVAVGIWLVRPKLTEDSGEQPLPLGQEG